MLNRGFGEQFVLFYVLKHLTYFSFVSHKIEEEDGLV